MTTTNDENPYGMFVQDENGNPIPAKNASEWGRWYTTADRKIGKTEVGPFLVSTVFLGLDHDGCLYETMVFPHGNYEDLAVDRYATREEAEKGHAVMVARVRSGEFGEVKP
jgi:hypothetical protein